jgi:anhydro-N-acetylmuramic acid kinase
MKELAVGLMSGTSGDGVSLVLCTFPHRKIELLGYETFPYPSVLYEKIVSGPYLKANEVSRLNIVLGEFFAKAILRFLRKMRISPSQIAVVGSHGQTLYHGPQDNPRNTLQIGEPSMIAERTGIPVVADFRMRDLAAGGEGAPLIPFFDRYFFGQGKARAMQNIGGIANVTVVGKSHAPIAFDTGPGNCLMDWAVQKITRGRSKYDKDGKIARRGKVDMKAVKEMYGHPYFKKRPPKSTGRELFHDRFIPKSLRTDQTENLVSTLTYFTAYAVRESYRRFIPYAISEIIVSGGGALNRTLMRYLTHLFVPTPVRSLAEFHIPVQAKEPVAFGFFALQALKGKTNHLPQGTGAKKACVLGKIIPGERSYAVS